MSGAERLGLSARVILDSVGPAGQRLTTMEATFPRFLLPEFNTHRMLSKNSASSRALPLIKALERVESNPFVPTRWWANQPGMTSSVELTAADADRARRAWLEARDAAVRSARILADLGGTGVHKQQAARLLEPFAWHTVLVSGTSWRNFFALRTHVTAQPEFQELANLMLRAYTSSSPTALTGGAWHLPLIQPGEAGSSADPNPEYWRRVSVGRCARVSYLTHDGRKDPSKDVTLHDQLLAAGHMSPFEHAARVMTMDEMNSSDWSGNFRGFVQYRKLLSNESDYSVVLVSESSPGDPLVAAILEAG